MIQLVLTLCLLITSSFAALAQDAVATLYSSTGVVEVTLSKSMRTTQGREGLLLYERDLVRTGVDGKATILFRDGSEIRLFENTEFQIQEACTVINEAKDMANPHPNTGINKLRDAIRKAKPSIKSKFQQLTTSHTP